MNNKKKKEPGKDAVLVDSSRIIVVQSSFVRGYTSSTPAALAIYTHTVRYVNHSNNNKLLLSLLRDESTVVFLLPYYTLLLLLLLDT